MFERWRQENFFKYMREEFLLDALIDYQIEREDPTRTIPNPKRRALDKAIRAARIDLAKLEREYGAAAADNTEWRRPTMRGFKIAHRRLGKQLRTARVRVAQLFEQRRDVPKRVEVRDINESAMVKLATERKHLTDIIKMVAYQVERICLHCCDLTTHVSTKKAEPCCTSYLPLQVISASPIASCISLWRRSARRIELAPPRPSAKCSTKPRRLSRLSPADALRRASATSYRSCLPRLTGRDQYRHRRRHGSLIGARNRLRYDMSGGLKIVSTCADACR
jgi:hypothetical protein